MKNYHRLLVPLLSVLFTYSAVAEKPKTLGPSIEVIEVIEVKDGHVVVRTRNLPEGTLSVSKNNAEGTDVKVFIPVPAGDQEKFKVFLPNDTDPGEYKLLFHPGAIGGGVLRSAPFWVKASKRRDRPRVRVLAVAPPHVYLHLEGKGLATVTAFARDIKGPPLVEGVPVPKGAKKLTLKLPEDFKGGIHVRALDAKGVAIAESDFAYHDSVKEAATSIGVVSWVDRDPVTLVVLYTNMPEGVLDVVNAYEQVPGMLDFARVKAGSGTMYLYLPAGLKKTQYILIVRDPESGKTLAQSPPFPLLRPLN